MIITAKLGQLFSFVFIRWCGRRNSNHPFVAGSILLVTAHPDDESMFFAPTVLQMTHNGLSVDLLCLSHGNYDGMGAQRVKELQLAALELGIRHVEVIDSDKLPDDPSSRWSVDAIKYFVLITCDRFNSNYIVSFDRNGVSSHPNHCDLSAALQTIHGQGHLPPLLCLKSLGLMRKYINLFDSVMQLFDGSESHVIQNPLCRYIIAWKAMLNHKSQLIWFRWLYLFFSTYMYKNILLRC